jgi:hypothetical protein
LTQAAQQLLEAFEALPETDKQAVATEILRRTLNAGSPGLDDDDLVLAADQIFLELS